MFLFVCVSYFYVQGKNSNLTFRWRKSILPNTEIIRNVWNPNFHYCVAMNIPLVSSLSKKDLINIVTSYLLAILSLTRVVLRLDTHGSVHRRWLSRNTNKMQLCNRIYYSKVYWRLNMFRAAHRSSSGALNCICSLWFIYSKIQNLLSIAVYKPEPANTV
jgi:hypothetical protein